MDIEQFRLNFPEFSDEVRYPSAQILFQSTLATASVNSNVWGAITNNAISLYVAHQLSISAPAIASSASGGSSTGSPGVVSSKAVGGVSVAYDTTVGSEQGAGYWNLSIYGKQYYRLLKLYGAGAIQL